MLSEVCGRSGVVGGEKEFRGGRLSSSWNLTPPDTVLNLQNWTSGPVKTYRVVLSIPVEW